MAASHCDPHSQVALEEGCDSKRTPTDSVQASKSKCRHISRKRKLAGRKERLAKAVKRLKEANKELKKSKILSSPQRFALTGI